jgi:RimJ/RimL family protein N-acetyltransferase
VLPAGSLSGRTHPVLSAAGGLTLRPWRPADAPAVATAFADPEIQRWHTHVIDSPQEAVAWINEWAVRWALETNACWAITGADDVVLGRVALREINLFDGVAWINEWAVRWALETNACWAITGADDVVLGRVALREINLFDGVAEVAYWVLPGARGRGVVVRATDELARWSFEDLGLHRLTLRHSTRNHASCRAAEKAGFALEGTERSALLHTDGWHDMHLHARLADPSSS